MKPAELVQVLHTVDARRRREIIRELPDSDDSDLLHSVCNLLADEDPSVREAAVDYLSACADQQILTALIVWTKSDHRTARNAAMDLLIRMADRIYLPLVIEHLNGLEGEALKNALDVLSHVTDLQPKDRPVLLERLRPLLRVQDANIVGACIQVIGDLRLEEAARELKDFLQGPPWIQINTIRALEKIGNETAWTILQDASSLSVSPTVRSFLEKALNGLKDQGNDSI